MLTKLEQILFARGGGAVERAHVVRHSGSYSVAAHSWGMAMLLLQLYPEEFKRLVGFALVHDVPECLVGDVPSTSKVHSPESDALEDAINRAFGLPEVTKMGSREYWILKTLDHLELYLWAQEQLQSGNVWAMELIHNLQALFETPAGALEPVAFEFYAELRLKGARPDRSNLLSRIRSHYNV